MYNLVNNKWFIFIGNDHFIVGVSRSQICTFIEEQKNAYHFDSA